MGSCPGLNPAQRRWLCKLLVRGAQANGFANDTWTLRRIGQLIEQEFGIVYGKTSIWLLLKAMGFSCQCPAGRASQRNEEAIRQWRLKRWPMLKKKARRERRVILFIDESGLSERPIRIKTWAPVGCTPVLRYSFNWKQLTVIATLGAHNFHFRFVYGPIGKVDLVHFLETLHKKLRRKLLIIWDGLPQHRSKLVADYLQSTSGKVVVDYLPGYAPELNPSEYIWAYLKQRELGNLCRTTIGEGKAFASSRLKSMQRRAGLVVSFWKQAGLKP